MEIMKKLKYNAYPSSILLLFKLKAKAGQVVCVGQVRIVKTENVSGKIGQHAIFRPLSRQNEHVNAKL